MPPSIRDDRRLLAACLAATVACAVHAQPGTVALSSLPLDRRCAEPSLMMLGLNSNVSGTGTLAFLGGCDPDDWSGLLKAAALDDDGHPATIVWDAGAMLTDAAITSPSSRTILTAHLDDAQRTAAMAFEPNALFDEAEQRDLMTPAPFHTGDTLAKRVSYLRGERAGEHDGVFRARRNLLGAIVHAQAVYVGYPSGSYSGVWPNKVKGITVPAPETAPGAQPYEQFVAENAARPPAAYVAANDGMLHAFHAPFPRCTHQDQPGHCTAYDAGANAGREWWAYVPRAVYRGLGNFTSATGFHFQPTVDATPVMRDVFFSQLGRQEWHTVLAGGLRLGGRGVYALDITQPGAASEAFPQRTVLWEFDADLPPGIADDGLAYTPADLGYTYGQPAIARLANGHWAVLIPNGYFPDCSTPDQPTDCAATAASAPANYSALFVLDAQTGKVIAELKTPTSIPGVASYGLTTPVLGDLNNDQIDDVAFAGDLAGNLWRFDLSSPKPSEWRVTLAYQPTQQGIQPITVMPRLFPDPVTQRFIVVFGTGQYLSASDDTRDGIPTQSIYGIRDEVDKHGHPITVTRDALQEQAIAQADVTDDDGETATVRSLSSNPVSAKAGGWFIDLKLIPGERVVTTPTALFQTNTALVSTFIPNNAAPEGALIAIDAATGGPGHRFTFAGSSYAGALIEHPAVGMLPSLTRLGGGKLLLPGITLKGKKAGMAMPLSFDSPIWRRRSWSLLTPDS